MKCSIYLNRRVFVMKSTKRHVRPAKTQICLGIRQVWAESLLCIQWVVKDPSFLHADNEDSDQTGLMPRLIWVFHYENMPIQIYWKFHHQKTQDFSDKNSVIFHISAQNIDCGYSLEPPRRGGSNEYPQSLFRAEIRKIMYTPVNPSFTI